MEKIKGTTIVGEEALIGLMTAVTGFFCQTKSCVQWVLIVFYFNAGQEVVEVGVAGGGVGEVTIAAQGAALAVKVLLAAFLLSFTVK